MIRILKIAILGCIFVIVAGVSAYLTLTMIIKSEDSVIVPDLIGKDVVFVLEQLTDLGLNTKVKGSEYSETIPKNHIIFQDPDADSEIKKGRDVKIVLSKGTQSILMPNLVGLPERQARIILEENGLCQGVASRTHHHQLDQDFITAQMPLSGQMIRRGRCVDMLISMGIRPKALTVPDFKGLFYEEALLKADQNSLSLGPIETSFEYQQPQNMVLEQKPPAGYRITVGSRVTVIVNQRQPLGEDIDSAGFKQSGLFRYHADTGFLRIHIHLTLKTATISSNLFDNFVNPGEDIWLLVPDVPGSRLVLLEDDLPVMYHHQRNWPKLLNETLTSN